MTKTTNYQLNQWAKSDRLMMDDFNADNQKLDAALAGKAELVTGTYTGDGAESRVIDLGFMPKAVLLVGSDVICLKQGGSSWLGIFQQFGASASSSTYPITDNGFTVSGKELASSSFMSANTNQLNMTYFYIAFR